MRSNRVYAGIYSALLLLVSLGHVAADKTVWDYAPDFSKDPFPPYPDLKNSDGSSITVQNLRGVHLYGWKGCQKKESDGIKEAYNDFYKMAQLPELYANIDWNDKAAREFWGPSTGKTKIPDGTRNEIQRAFHTISTLISESWKYLD